LANKHTSHGVLVVFVVLVGLVLAFGSNAVMAAQYTYSSTITTSGTMWQPAPTRPAVIQVPANDFHVTVLTTPVSGICHGDVIVEIYDNGVFVGAVQCVAGTFHIDNVELTRGSNTLIAKIVDKLGQYGPDSAPVTGRSIVPGSGQLVVTSDTPVVGGGTGETVDVNVLINGNTHPFAVSVDWGDGSSPDLVARNQSGGFTLSHAYEHGGVYHVVINVTDASGVKVSLQTIVIVHGALGAPTGGTTKTRTPQIIRNIPPALALIWPLYLLLLALVLAFWSGERYEFMMLKKHHRLRAKIAQKYW
jgi:hypothetical protein